MHTKKHVIELIEFCKKYFATLFKLAITISIIWGIITTVAFIRNGEVKTFTDGIAVIYFTQIGCAILSLPTFLGLILGGSVVYICHGILQDILTLIVGLTFLQFIYFLICILTVFLSHEVYKSGVYISGGFLIAIPTIALLNIVLMFCKNHRKV